MFLLSSSANTQKYFSFPNNALVYSYQSHLYACVACRGVGQHCLSEGLVTCYQPACKSVAEQT